METDVCFKISDGFVVWGQDSTGYAGYESALKSNSGKAPAPAKSSKPAAKAKVGSCPCDGKGRACRTFGAPSAGEEGGQTGMWASACTHTSIDSKHSVQSPGLYVSDSLTPAFKAITYWLGRDTLQPAHSHAF